MRRELTPRAVVLGLLLAVVMGAANVYLGLKVGMTVSASIPAAVVAILILRSLAGGGSILEANQVQTAASAGESVAAGIIFTIPAFVLLGIWGHFELLYTTLIGFAGGLLGVLLMVPLRRVFVLPTDTELKFPEGVACAAVLQSGQDTHSARRDARLVIRGAVFGLTLKGLVSFLGLLKGSLEGAVLVGQRVFYLGGDVSVALLGVGLIVQLNVALLIFVGGAFAWLVVLPLLGPAPHVAADPVENAYALWSAHVRYVGVGAMAVAGIATVLRVRRELGHALRIVLGRRGRPTASDTATQDLDLSSRTLSVMSAVCVVLIGSIYLALTGQFLIAAVATVIMITAAFFFSAVASYIVGLVGNSNSPVSGMTITTLLLTGGLLLVFGLTGGAGMSATLGVAAVVCCTACTAGDICNDLKTGQLVGASPRRQQLMQMGGIAVASAVMAPVLQLLHDNTPGGIGGRELAAPQAQLMASLVEGFFGDTRLPWDLVACGAGVGLLLLALDRRLTLRNVSFRVYPMPVAVGMYLPFRLTLPILLGGLISWQLARHRASGEGAQRSGVLLASGAIAGESIMGVAIALLASFGVRRLQLGLSDAVQTGLTSLAVGVVLVYFYRVARQHSESVG